MRYLVYAIFLICSFILNGQSSNLIFFTEEGENFTLYVNGAKINETPSPRSKASGITTDFAQIKIEFETPGAPVMKSNLMVESGKEMTAVIRKNKKGKYVTRLVSVVDASDESTSEKVSITNSSPPTQAQPLASNTNSNRTTTTATVSTETPDKEVGISISAGGETFNMSVKTSGEEQASSNSTSTVTNSGSTSIGSQLTARVEGSKILLSDGRVFTFKYVNSNRIGPVVEMKQPAGAQVAISYDGVEAYSSEVPFVYQENDWKKSKVYFKLSVSEPTESWSVKLKHNSSKMIIDGASAPQVMTTFTQPAATSGCTRAMTDGDFGRAKESIENKSFGDEQMTVFKQVIRSNCLSVSQVIGMMDLFTYEDEKLEVAKLAYTKTVDKGNYYQVNDALTYSDSVVELEAFLEKQ